MEELLKEYATLKNRVKADTARINVLQETIEGELKPDAEIEDEYGNFKMVSRTSYTYSKEYQEAEEDLKIRKTDEQEQGIAVPTTVYGLRYTAPAAK